MRQRHQHKAAAASLPRLGKSLSVKPDEPSRISTGHATHHRSTSQDRVLSLDILSHHQQQHQQHQSVHSSSLSPVQKSCHISFLRTSMMESIQLAQMLADLSDLNAAVRRKAAFTASLHFVVF
jgi:hypothetical protein